ncbi:MAG: carboxypeptidase-like regulatory domain-containing protein, partial [Candidatus Riflebacteria bacterium]
MVKQQKSAKGRWLLLIVLTLASIVFTGCEKGSLGVKGGTAMGYIMNVSTDKPISEVLVRAVNAHQSMTTYSTGDGSYSFHDMTQGDWSFSVEKTGYVLSKEA